MRTGPALQVGVVAVRHPQYALDERRAGAARPGWPAHTAASCRGVLATARTGLKQDNSAVESSLGVRRHQVKNTTAASATSQKDYS